jgi:hypothetical protein
MITSDGVNIQPTLEFDYKGFFGGFWASTSLNGDYKEPDVYLGYATENFSFTLYDYNLSHGVDYFNFEAKTTSHALDAIIGINGPEQFPISLSVASVVYGADKKIESYDFAGDPIFNEKNNFSTYAELNYPVSTDLVDLKFQMGASLFESGFYYNKKTTLINVSVIASKELKINENFSLPLSFSAIANPNQKQIFFVFMVSL